MLKTRIRQAASQALETLIPENSWDEMIERLDRDGKMSRKALLMLTVALCKQVEVLEERIELLSGQPNMAAVTLRTAHDVYKELAASQLPKTKAFYVDANDWRLLEKAVDPKLAKTKAEYGLGREVDPKDGKEKVCLFYHDLPVFKQ